MRLAYIALAAAALVPAAASAQTALTTTTYTENFDSLPTGPTGSTGSALPAGFTFVENGSSANGTYGISNATPASSILAGNTYAFGFATTATDRAFGSAGSDSLTSAMYGFVFTNGLGGTIDSFDLSYQGEQWFRGTSTDDGLTFQYSTDATSLTNGTWTSVNSLFFAPPSTSGTPALTNGNLALFKKTLTGSITGLSIEQGGTFAFRWTDVNSNGDDYGLAIDDVKIISTLKQESAVPEPATWAMMMMGFGAMGTLLRKRPRANARVRFA